MAVIEVVDGGLFTTVQDLGRYGYQRFGVPTSGAMDPFALRVANILVANQESAAGLELTLLGPQLKFLADALVALAGADLTPRLDGQPVPMWQSVAMPRNSVLSFAGPRDGARAYLAVVGGIQVPLVLGSRSTYTRSRLGGLDGRTLRQGDVLHTIAQERPGSPAGRMLPQEYVPSYGHSHLLRVLLGPQDDVFTEESIDTLLSSTYTVSPQSDRMGYRLQGPPMQHRDSADIISEGVPFGAIQVAGEGLPIVLMADRGTTGGYAKIATVISVDVSRMAQAIPGDRVSFRQVNLEEAHRALREQEHLLHRLRERLG